MQRDKVAVDVISSLKERCAKLTEELEDVKRRFEYKQDNEAAWKVAVDTLDCANGRLKSLNKTLEEKVIALQSVALQTQTQEAEVQSLKMQAEETRSELKKVRKKKGKAHNIKTSVHIEPDHKDVATQTEAEIYYYSSNVERVIWSNGICRSCTLAFDTLDWWIVIARLMDAGFTKMMPRLGYGSGSLTVSQSVGHTE